HAQASRFLQQSLESRRRHFPKALRRMVVLRDDTCRTPYCDGSIQDIDHALPAREGGPTNWQNGSGLCAACNQIKENTDWRHEATPEQLTVTTPTGHQYAKPTGPVLEGIPPDTRAAANQEPSSQVRSSTDCYAAKPHRPIVLTLAASLATRLRASQSRQRTRRTDNQAVAELGRLQSVSLEPS